MSDGEEPPTKMSKYEEYLEEDMLEEAQEEWLSEGVLTDDDYRVAEGEFEKSDSNMGHSSQEEMLEERLDQTDTNNEQTDQNIEDTLNNLDGKNGHADELNTFLLRKSQDLEIKKNLVQKIKEEDDGNDTDDLLRLLEDDQQVKKKGVKLIKTEKKEDGGTSDDDEFIYESNKIKTLKVAKNALIKRVATKAEPEQTDTDAESSSDEGVTVKRMFMKNASKKTGRPAQRKIVKHTVQVNTGNSKTKTETQKPSQKPKPIKNIPIKTPTPFKPSESSGNVAKTQKVKVQVRDLRGQKNGITEELDEIINEEEFLEDEDFELDEEEFAEQSGDELTTKQRIMRPEMMDEEVPSDEESHSEDGSLYDELPSSDSEDFDDWFTLDIRSERASDYLPMLGSSAPSMLTAERRRCKSRVATLRQALSALTDSARRQADTLRRAAMTLAELDDTLRAS